MVQQPADVSEFCKRKREKVRQLFQEVKREKWRKDRREREKGGAAAAAAAAAERRCRQQLKVGKFCKRKSKQRKTRKDRRETEKGAAAAEEERMQAAARM